jgi:zinc protease
MYKRLRKPLMKLTGLIIGVMLCATLKAQTVMVAVPTLKDPKQQIQLDPKVRKGTLANGFQYFIRHNEEPKNRVIFNLAVKAGSILEDDDQLGLAHFIEHMSFNGTKHYPKNELVDYLQKAGVRFGADINAYTGFDETVYQLPIASDDPELLKHAVQIVRDWAQDASFDQIEIDKERGVVLEEKRMKQGATERMKALYTPMLLNNSRYAYRSPIGTDSILKNFNKSTIKRFYADWYRPNLQAIVVVGDIDVDKMEKMIRTKFSDLKNPKQERNRIDYKIPLIHKNQFIALTDPEMTGTVAEISIKQEDGPLTTVTDYRAAIQTRLFNAILGQRYRSLAQQGNVPYIQINAGITKLLGGIQMYNLKMVAKPGQLKQGIEAVWRETQRIKKVGFSAAELERVKRSYQSSLDAALKEKGKAKSDGFAEEYVSFFLRGDLAPGIDVEYKLVGKFLKEIGLKEVNELSSKFIKPNDFDVILLAPEKDKGLLPTEAKFRDWLSSIEKENYTTSNEDVSDLPLLMKEPVAGKLVKEDYNKSLNIRTLELSNGVTVMLKPTTFKNDEILFSGFSNGGTSLYGDKDYQSAANSAGIISSFGAGNYDSNTLNNYLSDKQLGVQPFISEQSQGVSGGSTTADFKNVMELLYAYLTEPRKSRSQFESMMQKSEASLSNREDSPAAVFQDSIAAILGKNDPRLTGPSIQKLKEINLDDAFKIYKERFSNASEMTFTFIGSFDLKSIKPILEKYLGSLPSKSLKEQLVYRDATLPSGRILKSFYKGSASKARVQLYFSGMLNYNSVELLALDALKETLEIRLLERLREQEGGVYSPHVSVSSFKLPKAAYKFSISFECAPENTEKLIASALDEIKQIKEQGPTLIDLNKFKKEDAVARNLNLQSNSWWLGYISNQIQDQESLEDYKNHTSDLNDLSVKSLQEAAKMYLSGKNYIQLILMPNKKIL